MDGWKRERNGGNRRMEKEQLRKEKRRTDGWSGMTRCGMEKEEGRRMDRGVKRRQRERQDEEKQDRWMREERKGGRELDQTV